MAHQKKPMRVKTCLDCMGDGFSKEPGAHHLDECKACDGTGWLPADAQ